MRIRQAAWLLLKVLTYHLMGHLILSLQKMSFLSLGVTPLVPSKEQHMETKCWTRFFFLFIIVVIIGYKDIKTFTDTQWYGKTQVTSCELLVTS